MNNGCMPILGPWGLKLRQHAREADRRRLKSSLRRQAQGLCCSDFNRWATCQKTDMHPNQIAS